MMPKPFISELDAFLKNFDKEHPEKSESQKAAIKKHARIFKLRDALKTAKKEQDEIWEAF